MAHLTSAHKELFRRGPDETFASFEELHEHCRRQRDRARDLWKTPGEVRLEAGDGSLGVRLGIEGEFLLNDWSFSQFCRLCAVSKETVNRLSPATAEQVFAETLPPGGKPMQFLCEDDRVRSLHGSTYTRLFNADVLDVVREAADGFHPPHEGSTGGTGLYAGEQDMFLFETDAAGWIEIEGEAFAPGFFLANSEVGRLSLSLQTFWYQRSCGNHLIFDACDISSFRRKHTRNVADGLAEIRRIIEQLVAKRDARRDGFAEVIKKAMRTRLGSDADEVGKVLSKNGIPKNLAKQALAIAREQGTFTIFAVVDALTQATQKLRYAGDRTEADQKIAALLQLAV